MKLYISGVRLEGKVSQALAAPPARWECTGTETERGQAGLCSRLGMGQLGGIAYRIEILLEVTN